MDQAQKDALLENFISISGVQKERALFFLESSNWELNVALSTFYENSESADVAAPMEESMSVPPSAPLASAASDTATPLVAKNVPSSKSKPTSTSRARNFASIHDYNKEEDNNSDEEEGQRFYAGGSEHSGNMIVGPPKKKGMSNDAITSSLFSQAKKHGAEVVENEAEPSSSRKQKLFQGSGYRLGDSTTGSTQQVQGSSMKPAKKTSPVVVLRLWSNGFTVGDGELRSFQDPQNADFLNSITRGQIPQELMNADGSEVNLNMEDHRNEEYKKSKAKMVPFSGQGHTLGATSSTMEVSAPEQSSVDPVTVDSSKPKTTVQIRLKDGTRIRQEFNHSHTVGDIRQVVMSATNVSNFVLMTTFPNQELKDTKQTIADAKLLNAMVVQKMLS